MLRNNVTENENSTGKGSFWSALLWACQSGHQLASWRGRQSAFWSALLWASQSGHQGNVTENDSE